MTMCKILMPIKPKYVDGIIKGTKKFEFRKIKAKRKVDSIMIYETSPVMKVVAEVSVENILMDHPQSLWNKTSEFAGIAKEDYDDYFKDNNNAIAYALGEVIVYDQPKELIEFGLSYYPQSYVYID